LDPAANKESVIKKINSIRTCFRKEYRKVVASEKSGAGTTDIYVPTLWYYEILLFLIEQDEPRHSISNIPNEEDRNETGIFFSNTVQRQQ
jgi:Alcohol dehydrogenase transcription factor Myb/SANT-like